MNAEEKRLGELMKATIVAMYSFKARHLSSVNNPESMRRVAEDIQAYRISSKRHVQAVRSELDSSIREARRQVSLGYWPRRTYDEMVAHLRGEGLIDISTWTDTDAERMKEVFENGEIRTAAQWRLATEYRDTVDEEQRRQIDDLIGMYEAKRDVRRSKSSGLRSAPKAVGTGSKLTSDDLAFAEVFRRSAVASYEYAATRDEVSAKDKGILESRADTWRTIEPATRRDLKDIEEAFWFSLSKLRNRLAEDQFQELTRRLQEQGLVDISDVVKARNSRSRRAK